MGANHSPGEKLQTFGLEAELIPRIDAVRKPRHKTRAAFYRAAVLDLLARMEADPRSTYTIRGGPLRPLPDQMLNDGANSAHAQHPKGNPPPHNIVSDHTARKPPTPRE